MVDILPCTPSGDVTMGEDLEQLFVENPDELIGKRLDFLLRIKCARGLPKQYGNLFCTYKWFDDEAETRTTPVDTRINPDFDYERRLTVYPVTQHFLDFVTG